jgi:hypothetical protein
VENAQVSPALTDISYMYAVQAGTCRADHGSVKMPRTRARLWRTAAMALVLALLAAGSVSAAVTTQAAPAGVVVALSAASPPLHPALAAASGPTGWRALNNAIHRIPHYRKGVVASWTVTEKYGHWGMEFPDTGRIYISPKVPSDKLYYVVAHEYGHARAYYSWGRNYKAADAAMNRWFGGGIRRAREVAADCMAIVQGATWTGYSRCKNARWRAGARTLLAGRRLP